MNEESKPGTSRHRLEIAIQRKSEPEKQTLLLLDIATTLHAVLDELRNGRDAGG